jgi:hypothetical protein
MTTGRTIYFESKNKLLGVILATIFLSTLFLRGCVG